MQSLFSPFFVRNSYKKDHCSPVTSSLDLFYPFSSFYSTLDLFDKLQTFILNPTSRDCSTPKIIPFLSSNAPQSKEGVLQCLVLHSTEPLKTFPAQHWIVEYYRLSCLLSATFSAQKVSYRKPHSVYMIQVLKTKHFGRQLSKKCQFLYYRYKKKKILTII